MFCGRRLRRNKFLCARAKLTINGQCTGKRRCPSSAPPGSMCLIAPCNDDWEWLKQKVSDVVLTPKIARTERRTLGARPAACHRTSGLLRRCQTGAGWSILALRWGPGLGQFPNAAGPSLCNREFEHNVER